MRKFRNQLKLSKKKVQLSADKKSFEAFLLYGSRAAWEEILDTINSFERENKATLQFLLNEESVIKYLTIKIQSYWDWRFELSDIHQAEVVLLLNSTKISELSELIRMQLVDDSDLGYISTNNSDQKDKQKNMLFIELNN